MDRQGLIATKLSQPAALRMCCMMLCADPATGKEVRGVCSNYLADLKPGDELVMTGPSGTALLLADNPWNKRIICVSTGKKRAEEGNRVSAPLYSKDAGAGAVAQLLVLLMLLAREALRAEVQLQR